MDHTNTSPDHWGLGGLRGTTAGLAAVVLIILNLLDALFTLTFLQLNVAQEVNPLMRWAYETSPLSFVLAKVAMVQLAVLLLGMNRHLRAAQMVEAAGAMLYTGVLFHHLVCLSQIR